MKQHTINSIYRQFYIADANLNPMAPEDWTDEHILQRHNTLKNITALCPEGDISARIKVIGPYLIEDIPNNFNWMIGTNIEIESGEIGVYEWPYELIEKFKINNGIVTIHFYGFNIEKVDEELDYYIVVINPTKVQ